MCDDCMGNCPACGEPIDCCQGHGLIGDPIGYRIIEDHDMGLHTRCHPEGCEVIRTHGPITMTVTGVQPDNSDCEETSRIGGYYCRTHDVFTVVDDDLQIIGIVEGSYMTGK